MVTKFGILDFGIHHGNRSASGTLSDIIDLVQYAEEIGIARYWLTEHHETGLLWRNPEIAMALLAGHTEKIKIGAAGVLLALTSPMRVANDFKLLANLFPKRIDLGFAKGLANVEKSVALADGSDYKTKFKDFNQRIVHVKNFLTNSVTDSDTLPYDTNNTPDLWVLGTSWNNFSFARENSFGFSLSLFHDLHFKLD